jgi:hypothetical protein
VSQSREERRWVSESLLGPPEPDERHPCHVPLAETNSPEMRFNSLNRSATIGNRIVTSSSSRSACSLVTSLFRPCVLSFLGLALAVAAWGLGYKISLYRSNSAMRCLVAKLWDKQPNPDAAQITEPKASPGRILIAQMLVQPVEPRSRRASVHVTGRPSLPDSWASFQYRLPLRSPPPLFSSLSKALA